MATSKPDAITEDDIAVDADGGTSETADTPQGSTQAIASRTVTFASDVSGNILRAVDKPEGVPGVAIKDSSSLLGGAASPSVVVDTVVAPAVEQATTEQAAGVPSACSDCLNGLADETKQGGFVGASVQGGATRSGAEDPSEAQLAASAPAGDVPEATTAGGACRAPSPVGPVGVTIAAAGVAATEDASGADRGDTPPFSSTTSSGEMSAAAVAFDGGAAEAAAWAAAAARLRREADFEARTDAAHREKLPESSSSMSSSAAAAAERVAALRAAAADAEARAVDAWTRLGWPAGLATAAGGGAGGCLIRDDDEAAVGADRTQSQSEAGAPLAQMVSGYSASTLPQPPPPPPPSSSALGGVRWFDPRFRWSGIGGTGSDGARGRGAWLWRRVGRGPARREAVLAAAGGLPVGYFSRHPGNVGATIIFVFVAAGTAGAAAAFGEEGQEEVRDGCRGGDTDGGSETTASGGGWWEPVSAAEGVSLDLGLRADVKARLAAAAAAVAAAEAAAQTAAWQQRGEEEAWRALAVRRFAEEDAAAAEEEECAALERRAKALEARIMVISEIQILDYLLS